MSDTKTLNPGRVTRVLVLSAVHLAKALRKINSRRTQIGLLSIFDYCIKIKSDADISEAETMLFVAQHTSIPIPKVHCAFVHQGTAYIVMDKIHGQMACSRWTERPEASRLQILNQLKDMVTQLRKIAPPEHVCIARVKGGPIFDCRLPKESLWGPFPTMQAFHKKLIGFTDLDVCFGGPYEDLDELLAFYAKFDEPPVFTHGDLSSLNIMVDGDDVVVIVDWETAGWLPPYWEYTSAWFVNPHNPFWQPEVDRFLTPMPHELRMEKTRRKYNSDF